MLVAGKSFIKWIWWWRRMAEACLKVAILGETSKNQGINFTIFFIMNARCAYLCKKSSAFGRQFCVKLKMEDKIKCGKKEKHCTLNAFEGSGGIPIAGPVIWSCMMRDWSAATSHIVIVNQSATITTVITIITIMWFMPRKFAKAANARPVNAAQPAYCSTQQDHWPGSSGRRSSPCSLHLKHASETR